jgi:hypothetical protein
MGKQSRDSGHRFERELRDRLKVLWPEARRGLGQAYGARECDIEGTAFRIEAKAHKQWPPVEAALQQVARDAEKYGDKRVRLVCHKKKNATDWRVTMELDEFIRLVEFQFSLVLSVYEDLANRTLTPKDDSFSDSAAKAES